MGKEKGAKGRAVGDAGAQTSPLEFAVPGAQRWLYQTAHLPLGFLSLGRVSSPFSTPTPTLLAGFAVSHVRHF